MNPKQWDRIVQRRIERAIQQARRPPLPREKVGTRASTPASTSSVEETTRYTSTSLMEGPEVALVQPLIVEHKGTEVPGGSELTARQAKRKAPATAGAHVAKVTATSVQNSFDIRRLKSI